MARIGRTNHLKVVNILDFGAFLDGGQLDDILLPKRFVPQGCQIGDELEVFVYLDSDDIPIATTLHPKAQVGQFACLKVTDTNRVGAFLDWNMPKELLVPFSEQKERMVRDRFYVVYVYQEQQSYRIVASSKLGKFLDPGTHRYTSGQAVSLMICDRTDIGYTAIINNLSTGLLFDQDIDRPVRMGMKFDGFIKRVRADGKLDVCLKKPGFDQQAVLDLSNTIVARLKAEHGFLPFNARTDAQLVQKEFAVSKRLFKMAIGGLYKKRLIRIDEDGIRLQ